MHRVDVPVRVVVPVDGAELQHPAVVGVRQPGLLRHRRRRVDPQPVDPAVEPEPQHVVEVVEHRLVAPVEVGLLGREEVQVPLPRRAVRLGDPRPGRPAERADPVVRRLLAGLAPPVAEEVAGPLGGSRRGSQRVEEPRVLVGGVVGDEVDDDPQPERARLAQHRVGVVERAEHRVYAAEVADVVAPVRHRRGEPRRDPQPVDPEVGQVGEPGPQAGQVALAVTVPVGEAARVDLVHHCGAPPGFRRPGSLVECHSPNLVASTGFRQGEADQPFGRRAPRRRSAALAPGQPGPGRRSRTSSAKSRKSVRARVLR